MQFGITWITAHSDELVLTLRVVPRASKTEVCGEMNGALKIRLQAPPVDGKANKALIGFLAERLDVAPGRIEILAGQTGRNKRVRIQGIGIPQVLAALLPRG